MRPSLSLFFTFLGVTAVYLFASGALAAFVSTDGGMALVAERALHPFATASPVVAAVLAAAMALLSVGILVAPKADIWVVFSEEQTATLNTVQQHLPRYTRDSSREAIFEIALLLNGLVVLALLGFMAVSAWQPEMTAVTGSLYCVGLLEALLGTGILLYLIIRRKRSKRKTFRPRLAVSAGLNFVEIAFLLVVFPCGAFG